MTSHSCVNFSPSSVSGSPTLQMSHVRSHTCCVVVIQDGDDGRVPEGRTWYTCPHLTSLPVQEGHVFHPGSALKGWGGCGVWCTVVGLALVCETNSWKPERGARTPERSKTAHPGEREVAHSEASAGELADAAWVRVPPCGCH